MLYPEALIAEVVVVTQERMLVECEANVVVLFCFSIGRLNGTPHL